MTLELVAIILATHLLADFFLQDTKDAVNKHKLGINFFRHISIYSTCFVPLIFSMFFSQINIIQLILVTFIGVGIPHAIVDSITSQTNKYFWEKKDMRHFFCSVGTDQFIHTMHLLILFNYLIKI